MTEFAGRISRYRPERAGVCSATRPATRTPDGIPYWAPLDLNPYLYFDARVNVSTEGGEVDLWYPQWYGGTAPPNGLSDYLDQGTAEWKPLHSTDGYIQFDNVDTRLEYDPPVSQAGVLICATDNGIFAYEVDADSVDEITALGWEKGYFQTLKLYAMTLLPATVSDLQIAGVIQYFEEELGATRNPTGSLYQYWRSRGDLIALKFDAVDFSGVTNFTNCWGSCNSLTSFPHIDTSGGTDFTYTWYNTPLTSFPDLDVSSGIQFGSTWMDCTSLAEFPVLDVSSGVGFFRAWQNCASLESFPGDLDLSSGTNFYACWYQCTSLEDFPANLFDYWSPGTPASNCFVNAWDGCSSLTATSVENILNSIATSGVAAPASGPDITIDYDDGTGPPSVATAVGVLKGRSPAWTITLNGVLQ